MNNTIKISLTIDLEGSTLVRQSEPETINWTKVLYDNRKKGSSKKIIKRGTARHYPLITKPASKHISITLDAYTYMLDTPCGMYNTKSLKWKWKTLPENIRIEAHLKEICEHHGGKGFTYTILNEED